MTDIERILPVAAMIIIGTMLINGFTLPGVALVTSIVLYLHSKRHRS